jgi:hypothetical protein
LLFCFFSEDTSIFDFGQFTGSISSHTQKDGSDLNTYFVGTPIDDNVNDPK